MNVQLSNDRESRRRRQSSLRQRVTMAGLIFAIAACGASTWWLAPPLWSSPHPGLLAALEILAAGTVLGELALKRAVPVQLDAIAAIVAIVLVLGGPVPAFVAFLLPDLVGRIGLRRYRLLTPGLVANVASYGWAVLAGWGVLSLSGSPGATPAGAPTVVAVTLAVLAVNWAIARGVFGTLYQGYRFTSLLREEYLSMGGVHIALGALAAVSVALVVPLGAAVALPLALIVLVPQLALPLLARYQNIGRLSAGEAASVYAHALATELRLSRSEREVVIAAAVLLHRPDGPRGPGARIILQRSGMILPPAPVALGLDERRSRQAWTAAFHVAERWDGAGRPAGVGGAMIPGHGRVLAVADRWAQLTAAGGPGLSQSEAILALATEAATRLDPDVVSAAGRIVETEARFADLERFQPKLGHLPLPRVLRAHVLPWALSSYAAA